MSKTDTPDEDPTSVSPAQVPNGDKGRAKEPSPTAAGIAGSSADEARADEARTMRDRVGQQDSAAAEAVTAAVQRPPPQRTTYPVITGTAAPRGQGTPPPGKPVGEPAGVGAAGGGAVGESATAAETAGTVDAPTSHIARSNVRTAGMPDLSAIQHPSSPLPDAAREHSGPRARPTISVGSRRGRGPLRAAMQLRSIDPWSTLKVSLLLSVAMFFVWLIAVAILYLVLDGMGVWDRLNTGVTDIMASSDGSPTLIGPGQVFGVAAIVGIINVVLFTAMATIGAFIYNMSADAVGGVEVTLADRD